MAAGQVYAGLSKLMKNRSSTAAKAGFLKFVRHYARVEIKTLISPTTQCVLRSDGTIKSLRQLHFPKFEKEAKATTPLLWNIILGATTSTKQEAQFKCNKVDVRPHIMTAFAMLCYARKPQKMKTLQESLGVQLWYAGAKRQVR